jgi:hypothetical protein
VQGYRRLATRQFIVEGILAARRKSARDLVHNLNDLPRDITAVATGGALEQVANCGANSCLCIVGAGEIPIVLI